MSNNLTSNYMLHVIIQLLSRQEHQRLQCAHGKRVVWFFEFGISEGTVELHSINLSKINCCKRNLKSNMLGSRSHAILSLATCLSSVAPDSRGTDLDIWESDRAVSYFRDVPKGEPPVAKGVAKGKPSIFLSLGFLLLLPTFKHGVFAFTPCGRP
jgi:hypothetical protein